jgi:hypothetical protein
MALLSACGSSVSVNHDYDNQADFAALKSFAWVNVPTTAVGDVRSAQERNSLLDKRIKSAVGNELTAKGYLMNESAPDFLLLYHTGAEDKINVTDWGYGYPGPYWYGRNVSVYQYTQGTLIVDIIDAKTKQLIWRGTAEGTIDPDASTEKREARLNEAVAKLMANFPPTR